MTREIKFRAWLPDMGKMIYSDDPDSMNEADSYIGLESGTVEVFTIESCDDDTEYYSEEYNDAKLMEFTGYHDKNGDEGYAGSIVKFEVDGCTHVGVIEFNEIDYMYVIHESRGLSTYWSLGTISTGEHMSDIGKIIGNIHETPELLEA